MSEVAISTYQTYLMVKTSSEGSYAKVVDIKDYPDMIGTPNMLDATTLSHSQEIQIAGIKRAGDGLQFTANYTKTNYQAVVTLEGTQYPYALWLGGTSQGVPDGHNGKFEWTGDISAGVNGGGVNEAVGMTITTTPSTVIKPVMPA